MVSGGVLARVVPTAVVGAEAGGGVGVGVGAGAGAAFVVMSCCNSLIQSSAEQI